MGNQNPIIVSAGWDKYVKVWNLTNCKLKTNHIGHTGYLNTVTMSPDGSLCASGGKDAKAMLWDLNDGKHLYTLDHADTINSLTFSPNRYWLCAATGPTIKIWDLESKNMVEELRPEGSGRCLLLALANKLLHLVVEAFSPPLPRVSWSPNSCKTYLYSMLYKLYMYSPQHKGQEASVTLS